MSLTTHGQYDLTQDREIGSRFVLSIISLMVFMSVLALSACFTLSNLNKEWAGELQGIITVEIPVRAPDGSIRAANQLREIRAQMVEQLQNNNDIDELRPLPAAEIREQLIPWLGSAADFDDLPIPAMIHIRLHKTIESSLRIEQTVKSIVSDALVDKHQKWLDDLSRLTRSLSTLALFLMALIIMTITLAVSGAVRARLASHAEEVDLLHLMGAQDRYIIKQFQAHVLGLCLRGCVIGTSLAIALILLFALVAGTMDLALADLPAFSILQWLGLLLMPAGVIGLATITAKRTVLSVLKKMP